MLIRKMQSKDVPFVTAIENETFSDPWSENSFYFEITKENNVYLVVEEEGKILGYCGMWGIAGEGQITNVAVRSESRRLGIGKQMLEKLLQIGKEQGLESFTLEVREGNLPAIHLYEELGFHSVGIRKDFYSHPKENAVIMWY